jgi:nucleoside-diphosphate-sugar epimerase
LRVLVTGAPGFIGTHVVRRFVAGGAEVTALVRPPSVRLDLPGVTVIPGDLTRPEGLGFLDGRPEFDVVCHLAADTRMNVGPEEMEANVAGTRNLLARLGEGLRGKRFLFASSIAAVDRVKKPRGPLTTEDTPAPRSAYAVSKLECEELLLTEAAAGGFDLTVLRLGTIYGPGQVAGGLVTLAGAAKDGGLMARLPWPGKISFGFVEDVAEVFFRLAKAKDPVTGTFFLSEGEGHDMGAAAVMLRDIQGGKWKRAPIPRFLLKMINLTLWLPGVRKFAPWSLRAALDDTILCDSEPIRAALDMTWTPLPEGLRRTFG